MSPAPAALSAAQRAPGVPRAPTSLSASRPRAQMLLSPPCERPRPVGLAPVRVRLLCASTHVPTPGPRSWHPRLLPHYLSVYPKRSPGLPMAAVRVRCLRARCRPGLCQPIRTYSRHSMWLISPDWLVHHRPRRSSRRRTHPRAARPAGHCAPPPMVAANPWGAWSSCAGPWYADNERDKCNVQHRPKLQTGVKSKIWLWLLFVPGPRRAFGAQTAIIMGLCYHPIRNPLLLTVARAR